MIRQRVIGGLLATMVVLLIAGLANGQEDDAPKTDEPQEAKTHRVSARPLRVDVELDGVFQAESTSEIIVDPTAWTTLIVSKAVEHGTSVRQGAPVIWLETDKLDQRIESVAANVRLGELSLEEAKLDAQLLEDSLPLDLKAAADVNATAEDDWKFFQKSGKRQSIESAEQSLESARFQLEYAQEELDQLEKMYKADDLTEETEEIILKRARRSVESSQRYLNNAEINTARRLKTLIPREEETLEQALQRARLKYENARLTLRLALKKKRLELAKATEEQQKLTEELADLKEDRRQMVIRAPQDGIVYYGRCEHGTWMDKAKSDAQLRAGGTLAVNQVVMTIVAPRPLTVRGNLAESELHHVAKGTPALITPKAFPNETVKGKVARISSIPISDSDFDCQLSVDDDALPESVLPGMACKIKLRVANQKAAIMIPAAAVFTDDNEAPYVYVVESNDRSQKRSVVRGEEQGSDVQIVNGLEPDEKILLEQPKDPSDE